jgi:uncharacterized protein
MSLPTDNLTHTKRVPGQDGLVFVSEQPHALFEQLFEAASQGNTEQVGSILPQLFPLPDSPPQKILTSLAQTLKAVVKTHHHDTLAAILAADSKLTHYKTSCYAIEAAADSEDFQALQAFLDAGWDVNESGQFLRQRPLLKYRLGTPKLRTWLLKHGADPNGQDYWSMTNLEAAAAHGDTTITQDLINHGGNPAADDSLIIAASCGNTAVAELLLKRGADINKPEKEGPTPGEPSRTRKTALQVALMPAVTQESHIVDLLLAHGANVEAEDADGHTPLQSAKIIAERTGNDSLLKKLEARRLEVAD